MTSDNTEKFKKVIVRLMNVYSIPTEELNKALTEAFDEYCQMDQYGNPPVSGQRQPIEYSREIPRVYMRDECKDFHKKHGDLPGKVP